jgi:uncharacterized protein YcsI (UPF0317 family)
MHRSATVAEIRQAIRRGEHTGGTAALAPGHVQANLVVLPRQHAYDFLLFCQRNPRPCPVLEVTDPGDPEPIGVAPGADLRTDLPRYRVYRAGQPDEEVTDLWDPWREDLVAFLLGCSFTFDAALQAAGVPVRHLEAGTIVPMYRTTLACRPAGVFRGPLVVSMRPVPAALVARASTLTARHPLAHGGPVHVGAPAELGILDLDRPDWGDPVEIREGELPVFWACGVTPQAAVREVELPLAITHAPGHMFITDLAADLLAVP